MVTKKMIGEGMATYIPLFLKTRISKRKIKILESIIEDRSIIINHDNNVILLETANSKDWINSIEFDKFLRKQSVLLFLTTNNRMFQLTNILVNNNNFEIVNMEYSRLENNDVDMILEDEEVIDWENFQRMVRDGGDFRSITFKNDEFTFSINNSGTIYLPDWIDNFDIIIEIIYSLMVKNG